MNFAILLERLGAWIKNISMRIFKKCRDKFYDLTVKNRINFMVGVTFLVALVVAPSPYPTDPDTYFWAYSTIIQAFAAMIALVAMFIIYTIGTLKQERQTLLRELKNDCVTLYQTLQFLALRTSYPTPEEAYKAADEAALNYRKDLSFFEEKNILKEAKTRAKEVASSLANGELNSSQKPGLEYIMNKVENNLWRIESGDSYVSSLLWEKIDSPLVLVGLIIVFSLVLLPWSPAVTNYYAKIPLSFLLVVVLGLSVIAISKIISVIREMLFVASEKSKGH